MLFRATGARIRSYVAGSFQRAVASAYVAVVDTFRRHSLSIVALSLLFTYLGKIEWYIDAIASKKVPSGQAPMEFSVFLADDLLFYGGLMMLFWLAQHLVRRTWIRALTLTIAAPVALVAICNVLWMRGTGGQLSASVINVGVTRFREVLPVLQAGLGLKGILLMLLALSLVGGLSFLFKAKWKQDERPPERGPLYTALVPATLMLIGGLGHLGDATTGKAVRPGWRCVADNVFFALARELAEQPDYQPPPLRVDNPSPPEFARDRTDAQRPNVVLFLMEAAALRATSLAPQMGPQTPHLAKLASEGLFASNMRSVLPHTSKSVVSMICGKYPGMQHEIIETADNYGMHCLPSILKEYGYATAFFQSADGRFEDRPRLVARMGFDHFEALQDLSPAPQPLGYLAGEDMGLVQPVLRWAQQQVKPFFVTIVTSSTHHNYEVPRHILKQAGLGDANSTSMVYRYLRLVNYLDVVLSKTVDALTGAGRMDGGVLVVAGDHGEAFGEHGGYQHDNIAWEEGLLVPYVVRAPGRISPGQVVREERSLLDTAPTILDLVGVRYLEDRFDGRTLLRKAASPVRRYFSCWYSNVCVGYVEDLAKLIYMPTARSWGVYNLATDPLENFPLVDPPEWRDRAMETYRWYNRHRFTAKGLKWSRSSFFGGAWICADGQGNCTPARR